MVIRLLAIAIFMIAVGGTVSSLGFSIHSSTPKACIYLTFDDGPDTQTTVANAKTLSDYGVRGTFFMVGSREQAYPAIVKTVDGMRMRIGNHSYSHPHLDTLNSKEVFNEILGTNQITKDITGKYPVAFRPPYGGVNGNVDEQARKLGYIPTLWNVDTHDYSGANEEGIIKSALSAKPGQIILFHDGDPQTVKALPKVLQGFRDNNQCVG